ncbi:tripartite motif-containing protein 2-like [Branchiostoma floridae x Branchiostoma belcheri]
MNLAIGVRNPSRDMVDELQGAVASSDHEDVVVVQIPATNEPSASKKDQPESESESVEDQDSKQPDDTGDLAEGSKKLSAEVLPEVASGKPAPYTDDVPTLSKKLLPEAEDGEGEISVSFEGYAATVPLGTGAAAAADFPPEGFDDEFLNCDICQHIYKDPRVTPCGHTFCTKCLETWWKEKNEFTCPTCRKQVPLQGTGVASLPRNYKISELLDFRASQNVKEYPQCQMCEFGARIAGSCRDCHFFVCKSCIAAHSKAPALRHHLITLIRSSTEFCPKHANQPMAFYCQPCAKLVCQDCIKTEHQQELHNPQEVSKVAQRIKDDLQTLVVKMRDMQKERDYILSKELICLRTKCKLERKKIQEHFAQLRAKLDKEEQEMTNKLEEMEEQQQTSIEEEKKIAEGTSKSTEGLQFYDNIIARSSDVEIVALGYQLKDNLSHYLHVSTNPMQHTRAWHDQIAFVAEEYHASRRINQGYLTQYDRSIMVTDLPIESLPTTFIVDRACMYYYHDHEILPKVAVTPFEEPDTDPDGMGHFEYIRNVPEDKITRIDTTRISKSVFEAAWRPQTSGKHMVGIVEGGKESAAVNWRTCRHMNSPLIVDVTSNNPVLRFGQEGNQQGHFDRPRDVAVSGDRLYVADSCNKRVQVFDLSGNFCSSFPTIGEAVGLSVQTDGTIVVNCDKEVKKFSQSGEQLHKFALGECCSSPYGLAVQSNGRVVVADDDKHSIFLFEADGTLVKQVGGKGRGEGQFKDPGLVCVDGEDNIIVSDIENDCVQVFDSNLVFKHKFGEEYDGDSDDDDGDNDDDDQFNNIPRQDMFGPMGVSVDSKGNIVLSNIGYFSGKRGAEHGKKLQVFCPDGTWVSTISSDGDKLNRPHGVAVTEDGHVFVADTDDHCIRKYRYM